MSCLMAFSDATISTMQWIISDRRHVRRVTSCDRFLGIIALIHESRRFLLQRKLVQQLRSILFLREQALLLTSTSVAKFNLLFTSHKRSSFPRSSSSWSSSLLLLVRFTAYSISKWALGLRMRACVTQGTPP